MSHCLHVFMSYGKISYCHISHIILCCVKWLPSMGEENPRSVFNCLHCYLTPTLNPGATLGLILILKMILRGGGATVWNHQEPSYHQSSFVLAGFFKEGKCCLITSLTEVQSTNIYHDQFLQKIFLFLIMPFTFTYLLIRSQQIPD